MITEDMAVGDLGRRPDQATRQMTGSVTHKPRYLIDTNSLDVRAEPEVMST
jgi:hypothetical protein